jgi:hypothetical protein
MRINKVSVAVPKTGDTEILRLVVESFETLGMEIRNNNGSTALDNLDIYVKFTPEGSDVLMAGVAADFTNPNQPLLRASGDLTVLAASTSGWFLMDTRMAYEIVIKASAADSVPDDVTVSLRGIAH